MSPAEQMIFIASRLSDVSSLSLSLTISSTLVENQWKCIVLIYSTVFERRIVIPLQQNTEIKIKSKQEGSSQRTETFILILTRVHTHPQWCIVVLFGVFGEAYHTQNDCMPWFVVLLKHETCVWCVNNKGFCHSCLRMDVFLRGLSMSFLLTGEL